MSRLIEIAKQHDGKFYKKQITKDELELAMAWAKQEVSLPQVSKALNKNTQQSYVFLAKCFQHYFSYIHDFVDTPTNDLPIKIESPKVESFKIDDEYSLNRKCLYCEKPIADLENLHKHFCTTTCKSRYHIVGRRKENEEKNKINKPCAE